MKSIRTMSSLHYWSLLASAGIGLGAILLAVMGGCSPTVIRGDRTDTAKTSTQPHSHDNSDMDTPLSKVPDANFPSPELALQTAEATAPRDPNRLPTRSINSTFRAFAAGEPLRIHALDVGAGACIVVECPGSKQVLVYDCGSMKNTSVDKTREDAKEYVENIVKDTKPIVVMSHAHADHVNWVPDVFENIKARSVWIGGKTTDYGSANGNGHNADLNAWLKKQKNSGAVVHHGFKAGFDNGGEPVEEMQCGDAQTFILTVNNKPLVANDDNRRMHANNLMLLVRFGEFKAIFTGDSVGETEAAALRSYGALVSDSTLLFASHHGAKSNDSNSDDWVNSVRPNIVVYSADTMPSYGHPKGDVVDRYRAAGSLATTKSHPIWKDPKSEDSAKEKTKLAEYVTELNGTVIIESDGVSKVSVECSRSSNCW